MSYTPPDSRSPKDAWDEQYRLLVEDPVVWVSQADTLVSAFETLADESIRREQLPERTPHLSSVAFMLAGFAVEVLLKALLVQTTIPLDDKGQFTLKSHRLLQLAETAKFPITEDEARLLEQLEEFATWCGRYPVPLTSDPMRPRPLPNGGFAPLTYHIVGDDWPAIRTLIERLKQRLPRILYK